MLVRLLVRFALGEMSGLLVRRPDSWWDGRTLGDIFGLLVRPLDSWWDAWNVGEINYHQDDNVQHWFWLPKSKKRWWQWCLFNDGEHFEMVARKLPVIRPKVDGPSELIEGSKWMGQKTQSGRSRSVQYIFFSRSVKLDGPQMSKCMTQNCRSGRSESVKVEGLKIFRTLSAM